jgi:hypothetical protein
MFPELAIPTLVKVALLTAGIPAEFLEPRGCIGFWALVNLLGSPQDELGGRTVIRAILDGDVVDARAVISSVDGTAEHC